MYWKLIFKNSIFDLDLSPKWERLEPNGKKIWDFLIFLKFISDLWARLPPNGPIWANAEPKCTETDLNNAILDPIVVRYLPHESNTHVETSQK